MQQAKQISLFITTFLWGVMIGGIVYSHIVYFPPYLSHLPESNNLITGEYGIQDKYFWATLHPVLIISTLVTIIINWKNRPLRKLILPAASIYLVAIIATALFFVPQLIAFGSTTDSSVASVASLHEQGQTWQHLSWLRGGLLSLGFLMFMISLTKTDSK
jgi:hypothetical protein